MRDPISLCRAAPPVIGAVAMGLSACGAEPQDEEAFASQRAAMVERQIAGRGVKDEAALEAMRAVPRHRFMPEDVRRFAYADTAMPIGHDQTISQPYIVAAMTELLGVGKDDKVLEIGTGSGYQAAVLGEIVKDVYTIEIVEPLAKRAAAVLGQLGYENVHVRAGDGYKGWPEHAPFDAVIVTAAPEDIPQPLVDQLAEGGRMVIPVGPEGRIQTLYVLEKKGGRIERTAKFPVQFVPMTGEAENESAD